MTQPRRVAIFAFDLEEASQIRGIRAIRDSGAEVVSCSYRRGHMNRGFRPEWTDLPLGAGANGAGWARLQALWRGALALCRGHRRLAEVEVLVARNLDMALLALLFRGLRRRPIPLIYQCFDIHSLMTARGPGAALARWLERRVLARAHRLVVSAPAFGTAYFRARQGYTGPVHLMENKIHWGALPPPRPAALRLEGPLRLGWVGTLRCPETFALLRALAVRMGPRVSIHLRGVVHAHQLPNFEAEVARHGNLHYEGRYDYPHGLARAYAGLDAVWAQDLWQPGGNSEWLLPNRIYEAGYFGCPCIAVAGSATARRIEADQSGICVPAASPSAVETVLRAQRDALPEISARLLSRPVARYCQQPEEIRAMLSLAPPAPAPYPPPHGIALATRDRPS